MDKVKIKISCIVLLLAITLASPDSQLANKKTNVVFYTLDGGMSWRSLTIDFIPCLPGRTGCYLNTPEGPQQVFASMSMLEPLGTDEW